MSMLPPLVFISAFVIVYFLLNIRLLLAFEATFRWGGQKIVIGIGWFPPRSRSGTDVLSQIKWSAWNFDHASW